MGSLHVLAEPPSVALIGGGFVAPYHVEALRKIGAPVIGLLGSTPERARPVAERMGIPRVYSDLNDLLGDAAVDSVHIASPNRDHFEQARQVLKSGRHVLCERPLGATSVEAGVLRSLARARPNQASAINANMRFYPFCPEMQARVAGGNLGRVLSITGSYAQEWFLRPEDYDWRVEPDGGSNLRAVADIGMRWLDLAQYVLGRPVEAVFADLATFHPERQRPVGHGGATEPVFVTTEDYAGILLRLADGAHGCLHVNQAVAGRPNRLYLEVSGTKGTMSWDSDEPDSLWLGRRNRDSKRVFRDATPEGAIAHHFPATHVDPFADSFKHLFLAVYGWVASGMTPPSPFPTFVDGHREARLCEAIARAAREGTWVKIPAD